VDDFSLRWNGTQWRPGSFVTPRLAGFPGHFGSAGPGAPAPGAPAGDALLQLTNGGPMELEFLTNPLFGIWFRIASLSGTDSLFVAILQAFDAADNPLGTYTLNETANGTGGRCISLSLVPPVPCNDAPYVGFYDPQGRIRSIYISVFSPGDLIHPIGFAIDSLMMEPVPEPGVTGLVGLGLVAIVFYGRKRRAASR
jgi:hypothetical protein